MLGRLRSWPPEILVAWGGFAVYLALILTSPHRLIFDEPPYLHSVEQLRQDGLGVYFLRSLSGHAGPLYTFLHYAFAPLTGLQAPWVRLLNPLLFLGAARLLSTHAGDRWLGANMLGCPFLGMSLAMAVTEIPAVFFVCGALLLFSQAKAGPVRHQPPAWALALVAGICFGLAIIGRQTYVILLPVFLLLIGSPRQAGDYLLFLLGAVAVFGPLFWIWRGPIPPGVEQATPGFSVEHAVLAFAYLGFATLFIAPLFLALPWRWLLGVTLFAVLINALFPLVSYSPALGLTSRIFPPSFQPSLEILTSAPLIILAAITLAAGLRAAWKFRRDPTYLFYLGACLLLLLVCGKMTHIFSSRYIVCLLPFWLFVLRPYFDTGKWKACRFALAAAINAVLPFAYWYM